MLGDYFLRLDLMCFSQSFCQNCNGTTKFLVGIVGNPIREKQVANRGNWHPYRIVPQFQIGIN